MAKPTPDKRPPTGEGTPEDNWEPRGDEPRRGFLDELKRRSVVREALAYIAASVLLIELVDIVSGTFGAPAWVLRATILVLALGFIPAVALAWAYEVTPRGLRKTGAAAESGRRVGHRRLTLATLSMLVAVVALYLLFPDTTPVDETGLVDEAPAGEPTGPPMVAVLPLDAVGAGEEAEFIADGVLQDLQTQLSRIPSIRVISYRAAQAYRDTTKSAREIGAELNAQALLQGSVSVAGDRLRLRVQLVDTASDQQLWAETYDRGLDPASLFAVQGEVAKAIAAALSATLTDDDERQLDLLPTENMAAYRALHQAVRTYHEMIEAQDDRTDEYLGYLDEAVAEDPRYAQAWAERVFACTWANQGEQNAELAACADEGLGALRDLAPESAEFRMAQAAYLYYALEDFDQAQVAVEQAIARQADEVRFYELKYYIARRSGDLELMLEATRDALSLDPQNGTFIWQYTMLLQDPRESLAVLARKPPGTNYGIDFDRSYHRFSIDDDAQAHLGRVRALGAVYPGRPLPQHLWWAQMMARDFDGAIDTLEAMRGHGGLLALGPLDAFTFYGLFTYHYAGRADEWETLLASAEQSEARSGGHPGAAALVAAMRGDGEAARARVQAWERQATQAHAFADWGLRAQACLIIAVTRHAEETAECMRKAIRERSWLGTAPLLRHWPGFAFMQGHPDYEAILDGFGE